MKPRIALVAPSLAVVGGQGIQARALRDGLLGDGYAVDVVSINPRFPVLLNPLRRVPFVRTLLNQLLFLPRLLRLRHADVAQVFSASYWSFLLAPVPAILLARAARVKVILHYHSGEADDHLTRWGVLVHPWLRLVDEIVVPSDYLREIFARHGYRTRVIRNVVDTSRFQYRSRTPLRPRLLSTRHLEPYYGVETVLRAFAALREAYPEATLTVAGVGSQEHRLRELARELGVAPAFVGRIDPEGMPALYAEADIFVNASVVDNQPVSLLEALAAGLPVVSTPTGDIPAMLGGGSAGLLVPSADPAVMAGAIRSLLENPAAAIRMTECARREIERYTWARIGPEWAALFEELCRPGFTRTDEAA